VTYLRGGKVGKAGGKVEKSEGGRRRGACGSMLFFGLFPVAGCELQFAPVAVPHTDTPSKHLHLHFICLLLRGGKFGASGATTPLSAVVVVLGQH